MYKDDLYWKKLQKLLPEKNRITEDIFPLESYIKINEFNVHLDTYENKSNISIIILHGVGGNGRLLSFFAVPLAQEGYNVICPDLPGYGFTKSNKNLSYRDWIEIGSELVHIELNMNRKVFLLGLSAGGMLAYNIACKNQNINGLMFTNLLDNREDAVKLYSAKNKFQAKFGIKLLNKLPKPLVNFSLPIKMVTNMNGLVNDKQVLSVLLKDSRGAGSKVNLNFLLSMMNSIPVLEPENFDIVPVILLHPGNDLWTPTFLSEIFFNKISSHKTKIILENSGHFPIEEPGLTQLNEEMLAFIKRNLN